jgi:uncharacterized membrane protein
LVVADQVVAMVALVVVVLVVFFMLKLSIYLGHTLSQ